VRHRQPLCDPREVGVHLARGLVAVGGVLREGAQNDEVELVRHLADPRRALCRRRLGYGVQVLHRDLERRLARERHLPRQHLVEHDPDGVEVGGGVHRLALRLLGREVLRRADD
jgi:hypothetical protein